MCKRTLALMLVLIYFCGCQSVDPCVRKSEFVEQAKQTAHIRLAMTTLDRTVDAAIEELRSTIEQNEGSIYALESRFDTSATQNAELISELKELKSALEASARRDSDSVEQNAQSIASLESSFDILKAQHVESISGLKSTLEVTTSKNSESIRQNTESLSNLESALGSFSKQNAESIASLRGDIEQLGKELAQFRVDVRQELTKQEADRAAAGQLAERVDELHDELEKPLLAEAEEREAEDASSTSEIPPEATSVEIEAISKADYNAPVLQEKEEPVFWQRRSYQVLFAVLGLMVLLCGPLVAEYYARRQKKLAEAPAVIPETAEEDSPTVAQRKD